MAGFRLTPERASNRISGFFFFFILFDGRFSQVIVFRLHLAAVLPKSHAEPASGQFVLKNVKRTYYTHIIYPARASVHVLALLQYNVAETAYVSRQYVTNVATRRTHYL